MVTRTLIISPCSIRTLFRHQIVESVGVLLVLTILTTRNQIQAFSCWERPRHLRLQSTFRNGQPILRTPMVFSRALAEEDDDDNEQHEDDDEDDLFLEASLPDTSREQVFSRQDIEGLTVVQLKQQLRLRGLKVSGRKSDLVERFLQYQQTSSPFTPTLQEEEQLKHTKNVKTSSPSSNEKVLRAQKLASEQGKELIDVTEYVEEEDLGQDTRTWNARVGDVDEDEEDELNERSSGEPEVWGAEARMIDDYEGERIVVDSLSHSVVEFKGSNDTFVEAHVVASRDALKPYLAGGRDLSYNESRVDTPAEERLREIQTKREQESKRPTRLDDQAGLDGGDEAGLYKDALHRDFSDWGVYTTTGAQLSAAEVQGVLLLSDVYGAFSDDTKALAEKIAFECQPVVVMVPDLFRGKPWTGPTDGTNEVGQTYEQWRAQHSDLRVNVDIRAAAACLRERYGVSSVVVWGTCYGGGRALEAASGWFPDRNIHDINGKVGPPPVDPMACIAWYPTRYNVGDLFGAHHKGTVRTMDGTDRTMAVMAVFAGKDTIPGARKRDAQALKEALEKDKRIKDHMVKVFPDQDHGFAHQGLAHPTVSENDTFGSFLDEEFGGAGQLSFDNGDAEVACLLSTAFMETYSRVFLPTVGPPISLDPYEVSWGQDLEMNGQARQGKQNGRDVRQELEKASNEFVQEPLGGYRIDPNDPVQDEELVRLLRAMESLDQKEGPYALEDDDDIGTIYGKMKAHDENFQIF